MFVSTDDHFSFGSVNHFTFHLPNAPGWPIRIVGQVVHHMPGDGQKRQGIGVKFLKMGVPEREFIKGFIREKLMEGIDPIAGSRDS
jgi:Tfp pilus assembly protein PilZ